MTSTTQAPRTILRVDGSVRTNGSVTRDLTTRFIETITESNDVAILRHDLAKGLPLIGEDWVGANFTPEEDRSAEQKQTLKLSDDLIADLKAADVLAIGLPIYNFGVPAGLKAWVDLIARARVTFRYTENGPEGLLTGKKAYLLVASGGTGVGSDIDFATTYMKHALAFVGITDVTIIAADRMAVDAEASLAKADGELTAAANTLKLAA
ncbi:MULTISPECIES: FMN-dependent NADH-azoreductase [Kordiimonas]|jgi:FMN-dependent NADH-azoreductase|uniref:FMN-dependent NADH-azoreductase n=1 Tax=Kordiimonas TaxID=288021 RepID=UPI00257E094D|nr:NAD(P)H-dependent oxidoreductase [Kordiimonas sp. UBA4487]